MADASDVRPGEMAISLPETYAAGIYFIGRIRTPFKRIALNQTPSDASNLNRAMRSE